jgi:predicted Fe-Mo cluster-binding NifX family protein
MKAQHEHRQEVVRVAVPYYGTLSLPRSGLSRVYFVADVDLQSRQIGELTLKVWDPKKEPNLSSWLKQEEVNGIICSDSCCQYGVALQSEGIWASWGRTGEVSEMIDQWLKDEGVSGADVGGVRRNVRQESKTAGMQIALGTTLQHT